MTWFLDIMQYEADQNMVFNYLMVSGLAAATDLFEKNGTGMTGGKLLVIFPNKINMALIIILGYRDITIESIYSII